jgi:cyclophilin family peptidyl-prolyl cis-trans isomerase/HEAT repeat protein
MPKVRRSRPRAHTALLATPLALAVCVSLGVAALPAQAGGKAASADEVRELGRLERADMVPVILPSLSAASAHVRAEAANALAQSLWPTAKGAKLGDGDTVVARVAGALRTGLERERNPAATAAMAQALGRLPYRSVAERAAAEALLARALATTSSAEVAAGAARGMLSLSSGGGRRYAPAERTLAVLRARVRGTSIGSAGAAGGATWSDSAFAWPRRLAALALLASRSADVETLRAASRAEDAQLRMLAARGAGTLGDTIARDELLRDLARDRAPMVRTEAARALARAGESACTVLLPLLRDSAPQTSVSAIDAAGSACVGAARGEAERVLAALVREGSDASGGERGGGVAPRIAMHRAAHAVVALAHISPATARTLLDAVATSRAWQARMYAARAAAVLSDTAMLLSLATDHAPNVRTEAVAGLSKVVGHQADSVYVDALASSDYQLVLTAAQALGGTPSRGPVAAALERSLAHITAEKRETSRDPRLAILHTLHGIGSAALAERLLPYLVDFDSVVADTAAAMVTDWTGRTYRSAPRPLPDVDERPADLAELSTVRVRVSMAAEAGGGSFELRLLPDEALSTVGRFVRLVRSGYYDGLTIHRVVPNFVVQGGSPGANEYTGDGPFLRDEVGLRSHRRGAVGISTRGRNTGDAQFFVDLVDLPRLDHDYTVFAVVASGMDTVDGILEGDVMRRVEIIDGS